MFLERESHVMHNARSAGRDVTSLPPYYNIVPACCSLPVFVSGT